MEVISEWGGSRLSRFYDLFKATRQGAQEQDPNIRPGDTIVLPKLDRKVTVSGQVRRPGTYQLLAGEGFKELIEYYGDGFSETGDTRNLELARLSDVGRDIASRQYIDYEDEEARNSTEIKPFDTVKVSSKLKMLPVVFFEGAIGQIAEGVRLDAANRLRYQFEPGEKLSSAARNLENQLKAESDIRNAYVIRVGEKKPIPVNITELLYGQRTGDVELKHLDTIVIPFRKYFVSVSGAVHEPGRYPYVPNRNWEYYVGLAGGIDESKNSFKQVKITDYKGNKMTKESEITPETTIDVLQNSFAYRLSVVAPIITTTISVASLVISLTYLLSR